MPKQIKFHFNDWGQDLLWITVDLKSTQIVDAGPFHKRIYEGKYVFCPSSNHVGGYVDYSDTPIVEMNQDLQTFKYKITQIEQL